MNETVNSYRVRLMENNNKIKALIGVVLLIVGVGLVGMVNPIMAAGIGLVIVGVFFVLIAALTEMLGKFGMTLGDVL